MSDEIAAQGAPLKNFSHVTWETSLGGDDALDWRVIHKFVCFGGDDGSPRAEWYKYISLNILFGNSVLWEQEKRRLIYCI
jgi:hypothetical protein